MSTTTTGLTGLVYDMDDLEYHARTELSSTGVRRILDSPARFQYEQTHRVEKRTYDVGHAVHAKVLGAGTPIVAYPDEYLTPGGNPSTKAAAKAWEAQQRAAGFAPIAPTDLALVDAMAEKVLAHKGARAILEQPGVAEVSAFAQDPETGVRVRARFDRLNDGLGVDLKTTAGSASATGFGREAARFGYPIQDAHYTDTLEWITGERLPMAFIVVEKAPPHFVAVHEFDVITRMAARDVAAKARRTYAHCLDTNSWPAYGDDTLTPDVPDWWIYQADEDYADLELKP